MNRTFKQFTIQAGGTPQPLVGTWVTSTTVPGAADVGGGSLTSIPVNDSSMFQAGDWALFLKIVNATTPTYSTIERLLVQSVPDSTHIKVIGLQNTRTGGAFATGDFVMLANPCNSIYVQSKQANTGPVFLGTQGMNKTGLVKVVALIYQVASGQPVDYSDTRYYAPNPQTMADLWCDGTTSDGYTPSFGVA